MVKLLHAADFHLDSPFDSLPPEKAAQRRAEQRESLVRLRELANGEGAQIVLLAGDLFDSDNAFFETTQMLEQVFSEIKAQIFIAPGNHDYYSPRGPYRAVKWPENVHIFRSPKIERVELPELGARVYGAGFFSPSCENPILSGFEAEQDGLINLMVLHGDTAVVAKNYNPVYITDIASSGLDYLALGHNHSFSGIQRAGGTAYAYSGCIEGRGFDETGDKGVIIGLVGRGKTELEFKSLCLRRCEILSVDYEALLAGTAELPQGAENDVYRLILTGERDGETDMAAAARAVEGRFWALDVRDKTRSRRDIWACAREDTLKGAFIRRLRESYDAADEEKREIIELAARYGLAAMENGEGAL